MRITKKTINKQRTEIRKIDFKKPPEVMLEFISNPNFKEEFLEFVDTVLSWEKKKRNEPEKDLH